MLGHPKYTYGDVVLIKFKDETLLGTVEIIDAFGTFFNPDEVCYDILVDKDCTNVLYKHIPERILSTDF